MPLLQTTIYWFYSTYTGKKISSIIDKYCKDFNVKVIFSPFKLSSMFSPKDFVPESLKSRVVYQFTCASCGARYIGETNRHFHTRVNEHLFRDKNSHVFKLLIVLGNVGTVVMPPVLKLLIVLRLSHNLKSRRVFILNG